MTTSDNTTNDTNEFAWMDLAETSAQRVADFINGSNDTMAAQGYYIEPSKSEINSYRELVARKVSEYLAALPNCADVVPVIVTIGHKVYSGAQYRDISPAPAGSPAAMYPERYAEQNKQHEQALHLYLVGNPHSRSIKRNTLFVSDQHKGHWHKSGWATQQTANDPRYAQYHPFGAWFGLFQHSDYDTLCTYSVKFNMSIRYLV